MKHFTPQFRFLVSIILIVFSALCNLLGATTILDTDTIDTDYTMCDDTIKINTDVLVTANATLTICPGTVIEFQGHHKLNILGRLLAQGNAENRIIFTAKDTLAGWHGIRFLVTDNNSLENSLLEYCIVQYGYATGAPPDNRGGGIFAYHSSKLVIEHCIFEKNRSEFYAGGIGLFSSSSPIIRNCIFRTNSALYGAGMHITLSSHPTIENCLIYENEGRGALFIEYGANPVLKNVTITNNDYYGIRTSNNAHPELINCIVWNNTDVAISNNAEISITHSVIEGGWTGAGNIDSDPLFMDADKSNFRLSELSPCINNGHPFYTNDSIYSKDLDGLSRIVYDTIDQGAYEFENPAPYSISFPKNSIYENELPGKFIGWLGAIDDAGGDSILFSLADGLADNESFYIDGDSVFSAETFDFESKTEYVIHVKASDNFRFPAYCEEDVLIQVLNRDEAPTDISISDSTIDENRPVGTYVGELVTNDPDFDDSYRYSFGVGEGDTNNGDFVLMGDSLLSNRVFYSIDDDTLSIRIEALNTTNSETYSEVVLITVLLNYPPEDILLSNTGIYENEPTGWKVGELSSSDVNTSDTHTYSLVPGEGDTDNDMFHIEDNLLKSSESFNYEESPVFSIRIRSTDNGTGSLFLEKHFLIDVLDSMETGLNVAHKSEFISVFPNPMKVFTTIKIQEENQLIDDVYIYNFKGQLLEAYTDIRSPTFTFYRKNSQAGIYLIKIISGSHISHHKLIIQ